jgi:uncharacterized protein DUF3391
MQRKKIEVRNLEFGMYVAELDRPWTDTPFTFQGFHLRDVEQLDTLKKFCKHVFVDLQLTEKPGAKPAPAAQSPVRGSTANPAPAAQFPIRGCSSRRPSRAACWKRRRSRNRSRDSPTAWCATPTRCC